MSRFVCLSEYDAKLPAPLAFAPDDLRHTLMEQARWLRGQLTALGFPLMPGTHPIIPVMLGEATIATQMADRLLQEGIYVVDSAIRSYRKDRLAFACSCLQPTPARNLSGLSPPSRRWVATSG